MQRQTALLHRPGRLTESQYKSRSRLCTRQELDKLKCTTDFKQWELQQKFRYSWQFTGWARHDVLTGLFLATILLTALCLSSFVESTRSLAQVPTQVVPVRNTAAQHNVPPVALHSALQADDLTALDTCVPDTSLSSKFVPSPLVARPGATRQLRLEPEEAISAHALTCQAGDTHAASSLSTGASSDVGSMVNGKLADIPVNEGALVSAGKVGNADRANAYDADTADLNGTLDAVIVHKVDNGFRAGQLAATLSSAAKAQPRLSSQGCDSLEAPEALELSSAALGMMGAVGAFVVVAASWSHVHSLLKRAVRLCRHSKASSPNAAGRRPSHSAKSAFAAIHTPRHALATSASAPDLASASLSKCGSLRLSMDGDTARARPVNHQPGVVKESHLTVRVSAGAGILLSSPQTPTRKHESRYHNTPVKIQSFDDVAGSSPQSCLQRRVSPLSAPVSRFLPPPPPPPPPPTPAAATALSLPGALLSPGPSRNGQRAHLQLPQDRLCGSVGAPAAIASSSAVPAAAPQLPAPACLAPPPPPPPPPGGRSCPPRLAASTGTPPPPPPPPPGGRATSSAQPPVGGVQGPPPPPPPPPGSRATAPPPPPPPGGRTTPPPPPPPPGGRTTPPPPPPPPGTSHRRACSVPMSPAPAMAWSGMQTPSVSGDATPSSSASNSPDTQPEASTSGRCQPTPLARQSSKKGMKLKQLHWVKLSTPQRSLQDTIWQRLDGSRSSFDFDQLEANFQLVEKDTAQKGFATSKKTLISLLGHDRGHVMAIELASIRVPFADVKAALLQANGGALTVEMLNPLSRAIPEVKEATDIRLFLKGEHPEHKGVSDPKQLAIVERYFVEVLDIPCLQARVQCFLFTRQFACNVQRVREQLEVLKLACEEVHSSQGLIHLLQAVLGVGNYLNRGTFKGSAAGFKLETLLKLVDCRGSNDCKTLLHFILSQLLQEAPQIQSLPQELVTVQAAAKLQVSGISSLLVDLRTGLKQVRSTILEPAEQPAGMSAADRQALEQMISFHQTGKATFQELEAMERAVSGDMKRVSEYFGELHEAGDPAKMLRIIRNFLPVFKQTVDEIETARARQDAQKRRQQASLSRTMSVPIKSSGAFGSPAASPARSPLSRHLVRASSGISA